MAPRAHTRLAAPLAVTALLLAGCSASSDEPDPGTDEPAEALTLRLNWGGFPVSWAVGSAAMQPGQFRIPYETLLTRTSEGEILPNLATEWEFGEGAMSLTLTLRDDVVFHDGEPFNAEAVKTNVEYIANEVGGQYGGPVRAGVESVEVIDEYTVQFTFTRPYPTFTTLLTAQNLPMGSPAAIADGSIETDPVGTSPWAYDPAQSTEGTTMHFASFEDYWGEIPPAENIELYAIPDDNSAVAAVINGEIDVSDAEAEQTARVDSAGNADWYQYNALRNNVVFFDRGPDGQLGDEQVRQALCYALDTTVLDELDITQNSVSQHFIEGEQGYNAEITGYPQDVAMAEQLMADAGNPTVDLTFPAAPFNRQQVEVYAEAFRQLPGVTVTVQELPVPEYIATWSSGQYELGIGSHSQLTPADWYGAWFAPTALTNSSGWASDELVALATTAQQSQGEEADAAWSAVTKQIADEALACGHMLVDQVITYNTDTVQNVQPSEITWEVNLIDYRAVQPAS